MLHVSCGSDESRCYQLAGEHCPMGYDLVRSAGASGNFLVRCRSPYAQPVQRMPVPVAPTFGAVGPGPAPVTATPSYPPLGSAPPIDPNDVGY